MLSLPLITLLPLSTFTSLIPSPPLPVTLSLSLSPSILNPFLFSLCSHLFSTSTSLPHIKSLNCRNSILAFTPPLLRPFLPLLSQTVSSRNLPPGSCCCFLWYQRLQNAASSNLTELQNILTYKQPWSLSVKGVFVFLSCLMSRWLYRSLIQPVCLPLFMSVTKSSSLRCSTGLSWRFTSHFSFDNRERDSVEADDWHWVSGALMTQC